MRGSLCRAPIRFLQEPRHRHEIRRREPVAQTPRGDDPVSYRRTKGRRDRHRFHRKASTPLQIAVLAACAGCANIPDPPDRGTGIGEDMLEGRLSALLTATVLARQRRHLDPGLGSRLARSRPARRRAGDCSARTPDRGTRPQLPATRHRPLRPHRRAMLPRGRARHHSRDDCEQDGPRILPLLGQCIWHLLTVHPT